MNTKHTPGPWMVENKTEIISDGKLVICDIPGFCRGATTGPHQDANARLIAAAPELLEALEAILKAAVKLAEAETKCAAAPIWAMIEDANDAVLKARGK